MNHKLSLSYSQKGSRLLFIAALIAVMIISMAPVRTVLADPITTKSDLIVRVISSPRHVKACQTFTATFSIKNRGPHPASHIYVSVSLPDPFAVVSLRGAPKFLAVGQTVTFSARIKVVAFVPGESRVWWVGISAMSDPYPDISIDPKPENSYASRTIRLIKDPVVTCP